MQKIMPWKYLAVILFAMTMLTACGQKGDLYLPKGQASTVQVG